MTRGIVADAGADWRSRMWWLAPLCVVASSAVAVTVLLAPTVGAHVAVPRTLVVATPTTATRAVETPRPRHRRPAPPSPSPSPTPATAVPTTQVVQPRLPVVTVHEDRTESPDAQETGDR
jgi:hypothetical protein